MLPVLLTFAVCACGVMVIRAKQLITAALWLAAVSALIACFLFLIGAQTVAVVELSVGAGLVTVLLVLSISMAGEDAPQVRSVVPVALSAFGVGLITILMALMVWPFNDRSATASEAPLSVLLWTDRSPDLFVHIVVVFSGMLGVLALMKEAGAVAAFPQRQVRKQVATGDQFSPREPQRVREPVLEEANR